MEIYGGEEKIEINKTFFLLSVACMLIYGSHLVC